MTEILINNCPDYAKHALLAGIDWTIISNKKVRKSTVEMRAQGQECLTLTSTNSQSKESVNVGQVPRVNLPDSGKAVSVAAWLAHTYRSGTILALEEVELRLEEKSAYWLCIVNDGQVVIGTDILIEDWETVTAFAESTIEALDSDSIGYVGGAARNLTQNTDARDCPELVEALAKPAYHKAVVKRTSSSNSTTILSVILLLAFIGAGGTWYYLENGTEGEETAAQAEKRRAAQRQRAQLEFEGILSETGSLPAAGRTLSALWAHPIESTHTKIGGWELQGVVCKENTCQLTYLNTNLTLPADLKASIGPRCESLTVTADGINAECTIPYEGHPMVTATDESGQIYEQDIEAALLNQNDLNRLQGEFMKIARLGPGTAYAINEPAEYPFRGSRFLPLVEMWNQGEWGLTFPVRHWHAVAAMLNSFNGIAVKAVSINWGAQVVELNGLYISQKEGIE